MNNKINEIVFCEEIEKILGKYFYENPKIIPEDFYKNGRLGRYCWAFAILNRANLDAKSEIHQAHESIVKDKNN